MKQLTNLLPQRTQSVVSPHATDPQTRECRKRNPERKDTQVYASMEIRMGLLRTEGRGVTARTMKKR